MSSATIAAAVTSFLLIYFGIRIFGSFLSKRAQAHPQLGGVDRFLGVFVGSARALVLLGAMLFQVSLGLFAGDDVEFLDAMIFVGGGFGGAIAFALHRHRMDQHRAMVAVADIFEHRDQMLEIMPVDRPDIIKAEFLEQGAAHRHAAGIFLRLGCSVVHSA